MTSKSLFVTEPLSRTFLCLKFFLHPNCWVEFLNSFFVVVCDSTGRRFKRFPTLEKLGSHKFILMRWCAGYIGLQRYLKGSFYFWLWILEGELWVKFISGPLDMGNPVKWQIQTESVTRPVQVHLQIWLVCKWFSSDLYQCGHRVLFRNVCGRSHIHINMDYSNLPLPFTTNGGHQSGCVRSP